MKFEQWNGFKEGTWTTSVDVRQFIQKNYTPYEGDESFLTNATDKTTKLWNVVLELYKKEKDNGGVLDIDTKTISTITSHKPGYIQKDLEEKAFVLGGSNYFAPIQRFEDFLNNSPSDHIGVVKPSYLPGVTLSDLNTIQPAFVSSTLKEGISFFGSKLAGFDNPDSILTGVETRSSSPVRIVRNSDFSSNVTGLFPCGEGAGYAGGIMTAAIDGIKCAQNSIK